MLGGNAAWLENRCNLPKSIFKKIRLFENYTFIICKNNFYANLLGSFPFDSFHEKLSEFEDTVIQLYRLPDGSTNHS